MLLFNNGRQKWGMEMSILELLGCFTVVFVLSYFIDSKYKKTKKKHIVIGIVITTLLAFIIQSGIRFLFN